MADADLNGPEPADLNALVPDEARRAFVGGDERRAATLLARARDLQPPHSPAWALLERLHGLALIAALREVEGTFALERADALLEAAGWPRPGMEWLAKQSWEQEA